MDSACHSGFPTGPYVNGNNHQPQLQIFLIATEISSPLVFRKFLAAVASYGHEFLQPQVIMHGTNKYFLFIGFDFSNFA